MVSDYGDVRHTSNEDALGDGDYLSAASKAIYLDDDTDAVGSYFETSVPREIGGLGHIHPYQKPSHNQFDALMRSLLDTGAFSPG